MTVMKKFLVNLPEALREEVDYICIQEHRNRTDLVREALRQYIDRFKRKQMMNMINADAQDVIFSIAQEVENA